MDNQENVIIHRNASNELQTHKLVHECSLFEFFENNSSYLCGKCVIFVHVLKHIVEDVGLNNNVEISICKLRKLYRHCCVIGCIASQISEVL